MQQEGLHCRMLRTPLGQPLPNISDSAAHTETFAAPAPAWADPEPPGSTTAQLWGTCQCGRVGIIPSKLRQNLYPSSLTDLLRGKDSLAASACKLEFLISDF